MQAYVIAVKDARLFALENANEKVKKLVAEMTSDAVIKEKIEVSPGSIFSKVREAIPMNARIRAATVCSRNSKAQLDRIALLSFYHS